MSEHKPLTDQEIAEMCEVLPYRDHPWTIRAVYRLIAEVLQSRQQKTVAILCDRADGVRGHYCIGREVNAGTPQSYWEFWNKGKWCSAGEVFELGTPAEKESK